MSTQTAAIYIRVSTEEQAKNFGIDSQINACTQYCNAFGIEIKEVYIDAGISGTKKIEEREALSKLITDAKDKKFDSVVFYKIDRLARTTSLVIDIWDKLEELDMTIVSINERIDTSTPVGRFSRNLFASFAELERDTIVQRTGKGKKEREKIDGETGGAVPFGYTRIIKKVNNVEVNEEEARVVRLIFKLKEAGNSLRKICTHLNNNNIQTPRRGKVWYPTTVKIIVDNEQAYRGGARGESDYCYPKILS